MKRQRLKDQIRVIFDSRFASFLNLMLVLMAFSAVFLTLKRIQKPVEVPFEWICPCPPDPDARHVTIVATANHAYFWDREDPLPISEYQDRLRSWLRSTDKPVVHISSDEQGLLGDAMRLLDETRRAGVQAAGFTTRPASVP